MGIRLLAILIFVILAAFVPEFEEELQVGYRTDLKTLSDSAAAHIDFKVRPSGIMQLRAVTKPYGYNGNKPRSGVEFLTFSIKCKIASVTKENNGTVTLVLSDSSDSTLTMLAQVPDSGFDSVKSKINLNKFEGKYEVIGIPFFNQKSLSPNGLEFQPIIGIKKIK